MRMLLEFHQNGKIVQGSNSSFIVLILKKENAFQLCDYRPISLIGCTYKILAKVLARSLSKVMESIILENQSAFVGKMLIHDRVIVLNKAIEDEKKRRITRIFFQDKFCEGLRLG